MEGEEYEEDYEYSKPIESRRNLGSFGYLFSFGCAAVSLTFPLFVWYMGTWGIIIGSIGTVSCHIVDYFTSDNTTRNISVMRRNGLSITYISFCYLFNLVTWWIPFSIITIYYRDIAYFHFDFALLCKIIFTLALTDVAFFLSHRFLHRNMPTYHLLHHCCKEPSLTTNLFFDPIDLAIEFAGPILIVAGVNILLKDYFAMVMGFGVLTAWYAGDHVICFYFLCHFSNQIVNKISGPISSTTTLPTPPIYKFNLPNLHKFWPI